MLGVNWQGLKALGVDTTAYGTILASVLLTKLPPDLRLIVSCQLSSDNLDMNELLIPFEHELTARE